ncbi:MAG: hypothetical protein U1E65_26000 [Myxococcota bacterium]
MLPLALVALVGATPPEMVVLPPQPLAAKPNVAADVYKGVLAEVEKQKDALGVSVKLQKDAKAAISGPAKEQGWECNAEPACLAQLGATLGADFLISGVIDKDTVAFVIVDVKNQRKVVGARSAKKFAKSGPKKQADAALKGALSYFEQWSKNPKETPQAGGEGADIAPTLAELHLAPGELGAITEVTLDGTPLAVRPDGSIGWQGPAGRHALIAVRRDGVRSMQDLNLEAGAPLEVHLSFIEPAPPPPPPPLVIREEAPPPPPPSSAPTGKWWFWVGVGGAVLIGGATAALLIGGNKGGPSIGGNTGTIEGTY